MTQHGGFDDLDNLALACIDCNLHKGPNLTVIDPETNKSIGSIPIRRLQPTQQLTGTRTGSNCSKKCSKHVHSLKAKEGYEKI